MASIIQCEQYAVEIIISNGETTITPENCDDLKIKLANIEKTVGNGELTYDRDRGAWLFPLTQSQTLSFCDNQISAQAQYLSGQNVFSTAMTKIQVDKSIIRTTF